MSTRLDVTSVVKDSPAPGQVTIVATYTEDVTYTQPSQRVTVNEYPEGNDNWSRAIRLTEQAFFCLRNGVESVALALASWSKIARAIEGGLTWAPSVETQPAAASCVASSTAANFTVVADSEDTPTYQWQYESKAAGSIVTTGTELADGDTVTINGQVYRFKDTPSQAYDVKRNGTTAATTLENLIKAINASGTPGSEYFAGTLAHPTVQAVTALTVGATTLVLRARTSGTAGNAYTLTESSTQLSVSGGLMSGGGTWAAATGTVLGCAYTNGTTATLTCTPTSTLQSGVAHRVQVTNPNSTVTSDSAVLTIT